MKLKFSEAAVTETRCRGAHGREGLGGRTRSLGKRILRTKRPGWFEGHLPGCRNHRE